MPHSLFELSCIAIIVLSLGLMRRAGARDLWFRYGALAMAGWLGEQTMIELYAYYRYDPRWSVFAGHVPVLIALIWPLVILSAGEVADALGFRGMRRSAAVGILILLDASLVEVVAVRAKLWSWAAPGYLEVPVIGILGWVVFAVAADAVVQRFTRWQLAWLVAVAPLFAHAAILALWWGAFRWLPHEELAPSSTYVVLAAGLALALALRGLRVAGRVLVPDVWLPRVVAAVLFVTLLATTAPKDARLWMHAAAVAAPYLMITSFRRRPATAAAPASVRAQGASAAGSTR